MHRSLIAVIAVFFSLSFAHATTHAAEAQQADNATPNADGLITIKSAHSVEATVDRLKGALTKRNVTIMAVVDHAANAKSIDQSLPPTTLVIFGNPAAGTPLMQASPTIGVDLPMKALIFETAEGVFYSYNDIDHLALRHGLAKDHPVLGKIAGLLSAVASEATTTD